MLALAWFFLSGTGAQVEATSSHAVQRGNMLISIVEGGTLRAANQVDIVSQVEGQARIIYLIPEGTQVERGDLLVELDSSEIEENLTQRQIAHQNAISQFTEATENLAITRSEADSEIALAELRLEFAEVDQKKYSDGDWPQLMRNAQAAIHLASEELTRASERLQNTIRLQERGFATLSERQADELSVTRRQLEYERSKEEERLLHAYEHPRRLRELESEFQQAGAALDRARSRAASQISQAEANLAARKATLDLEANRLARVETQLKNTRIYAPQSGLVIYENGDRDEIPAEGMIVRQRQELIELPDLSQMVVEVMVHESQISHVRRGQLAIVTIDAMPDRHFRGRVQRVAVLPNPQSRWMNPDLKVYTTEVLIEDELPEINPGVSAQVEIIVSQLQDVLHVPIQSVATLQGERVVFRYNGAKYEPVAVEIGMFNDSFVEVRSGLTEGDSILLSPPRRALDEDFMPLMIGDEEEAEHLTASANGVEMQSPDPLDERQRIGEDAGAERPVNLRDISPGERERLGRQHEGQGGQMPRRPA